MRLLALASLAAAATTSAQYPAGPQITKDGTAVLLQDYASAPLSSRTTNVYPPPINFAGQLGRISFLRSEPGNAALSASRFFCNDNNRNLYLLDRSARTFTTYINFEEVFPKFDNDPGYAGGLVTFVFDPNYAASGKFFTVHTEDPNKSGSAEPTNANLPGLDLSGGYTVTPAVNPPAGNVARQAVLVEWIDKNPNNSTFEGTARELLRIGFNGNLHPMGDLVFNPSATAGDVDYGNLYIAVGDGGAGETPGSTQTIPQRLDTLQGKILRITPDLMLRPQNEISANGRYRIPTTGSAPNPFISINLSGLRKEIYAYGLRNPHRMSWDAISGKLVVDDIGLHSWEEVNIVKGGANYGYSQREGVEQLFVGGTNNGKTGSQTSPPTPFPDPDVLTVTGLPDPVIPVYPVVEYSHRDGDAISSGFVYRGQLMPALSGKYIFADITTGRLFYADLEEMIANDDATRLSPAACHELQLVYDSPDDNPDQGATNRRLFDIVADEYARKGGDAGTSVLPGSATVTSGNDPDGVPYGGGRADVRVALGGDSEIYILSKSDGMVRKLVAVVKPPPNMAPVVDAGSDQIVPTHSTTLSGSATDDGLPNPPGTLAYSWAKLSGPGSVTFGNANAANSTANFSTGGVYVLQLSASDGALANTDTVTLTVNKAPLVNAGADEAITLPNAVNLRGIVSDDGIPGTAISTTWSKASGPGTVTFGDVHALTTTASFSAPGTYNLSLSASDTVLTRTDSIAITANPPGTTPSADLKVTITDGKTVVTAGIKTTYTITVTNAGPYAITGATVADAFPAIYTGATFTATQSGGASGFTPSGTGNINDTLTMPVASKVTYVVSGKVSSAATGNLANTVTAVIPNGVTDPTPANNSATDTDTIQLKADVKVTNTDGKTTAIPGQKNTYTIVVTNLGPSDARNAVVQDSFPGIFTGVSFTATATGGATGFHASGTGNINDTVTLPSGSKITYKATGTISASATGSIANTASVTPPSGVTDPVLTNNSATDTDSL